MVGAGVPVAPATRASAIFKFTGRGIPAFSGALPELAIARPR
jgi:hypothetical protein